MSGVSPQVEQQENPAPVAQDSVLALRRISLEKRQALSTFCICFSSIIWCAGLSRLGIASEGLPWYITIAAVAAFSTRYLTRRAPRIYPAVKALWGSESLHFLESWAITYLAAAVMLYLLIAGQSLAPAPEPAHVTHFVDIELTSLQDAQDRHSPMPATKEAVDLRKRTGDQINSQGSLTPTTKKASAQATARPLPPHSQKEEATDRKEEPQVKSTVDSRATKMSADRSKTSMNLSSLEIPTPWKTVSAHPRVDSTAHDLSEPPARQQPQPTGQEQQNDERPYLEEVAPPELVEMVDNDGDKNSLDVFQTGGNSAGGKGAKSDLSSYLKELHKRIKNAWSPPRGQSRRAEILFRLRQDGRLSFLKIARSSGDTATDEAAMQAVSRAAAFRQLPESCHLGYLDVLYTFNYTADELKEISPLLQN